MLEFSLLCLERLSLEENLELIIPNVDSLHLDIMDGKFVKNMAFTPDEINAMKYFIPKHVHIMSRDINTYVDQLQEVTSISFHYEATDDLKSQIKYIKDKDIQVGVVINPETEVDVLTPVMGQLDRIVLMAVNPGFSGQRYIPSTSGKIIQIRKKNPSIEIVVDGGMHEDTIREVRTLGADSYVVCSVIACAYDIPKKIRQLQSASKDGEIHKKMLYTRGSYE